MVVLVPAVIIGVPHHQLDQFTPWQLVTIHHILNLLVMVDFVVVVVLGVITHRTVVEVGMVL
jgi:hypothetical protein